MKVFIISYMGGMFGEFISTNINKYGTNYPVVETITDQEFNNYIYRNPLQDLGKVMSRNSTYSWDITQEDKEKLLEVYGNKNILICCHWFNKNINELGLPNQVSVRIKSSHIAWVNLAFILIWLKNHLRLTDLTYAKTGILKNLKENFEYTNEILELCRDNRTMPWYLHAYSKKWVKNGKLDFKYYFDRYYNCVKTYHYRNPINFPDWHFINIDKVFYNLDNELEKFNLLFETNVPQNVFLEYHQRNLNLIYDKLGLTFEDLTNDSWYNKLYNYCYNIINVGSI